MVEEIEAEVCWFHIGEDWVDIFLNKYPSFEPVTPTPDKTILFEDIEDFPKLRCNRIVITTTDMHYLEKNKDFRKLRKVLSKIQSNWIGEKFRIRIIGGEELPKLREGSIFLKRR